MIVAKPHVPFVCVHDAARSQMAEVLLRRYAGDRFEVASAALEATEVHPLARTVFAEVGIDVPCMHGSWRAPAREEQGL